MSKSEKSPTPARSRALKLYSFATKLTCDGDESSDQLVPAGSE